MIHYKKRRMYKYNLHNNHSYKTEIKVDNPKDLGMLKISSTGILSINSGYSWDGPSGPTFDSKDFMQASLVHDALYQLIREGVLPPKERKRADEIMREICLNDGMSKFRAWYLYRAVRRFGTNSAKPDLLTAP